MLLRLEAVHFDGDFGRRDDTRDEHESPAAKLRPVAEIEVFGQRVMLPPARFVYGGASPDPGRAVEVEEPARTIAAAVLEHEMPVEQDRLDLGEERVVLVDVPPPGLHH